MFPVTSFNMLPVLDIFWLKDVSHHHFWYCLSELKALSYISHVQRLAQKAISVGILNSRFPLKIHRFINKQLLGLYLEFSPPTLSKQPLARLSGWSSADCFHNIHLHDRALLKLWVKRGRPPLRYNHLSAVVLWCYLRGVCPRTSHKSTDVGPIPTVTTCTSHRYSNISIFLPS